MVLLLQELLKDWPCTVAGGNLELLLQELQKTHMDVKPGFIFVARKGNKEMGHCI